MTASSRVAAAAGQSPARLSNWASWTRASISPAGSSPSRRRRDGAARQAPAAGQSWASAFRPARNSRSSARRPGRRAARARAAASSTRAQRDVGPVEVRGTRPPGAGRPRRPRRRGRARRRRRGRRRATRRRAPARPSRARRRPTGPRHRPGASGRRGRRPARAHGRGAAAASSDRPRSRSALASSRRASASWSRSTAVESKGRAFASASSRLAGPLAAELDVADQEPVVALEPPVLAAGVERDRGRPGLDRGVEVAEPLVAAADRPQGVGLVTEVAQRGPRGPLGLVERQGGRELALLESRSASAAWPRASASIRARSRSAGAARAAWPERRRRQPRATEDRSRGPAAAQAIRLIGDIRWPSDVRSGPAQIGASEGRRGRPRARAASAAAPAASRVPEAVDQDHEGRDQDRADEERVEQDAQAQREAQLAEGRQAAGEHRAERAGHDQAARADDPAGVGHGQPGPLDHAVLLLLLDHPRHQEDVVVLADGHQDHEQEEADLPVEPDPGLGPVVQRLEDQLGHARARRGSRAPPSRSGRGRCPGRRSRTTRISVDAQRHQHVHPPLVARSSPSCRSSTDRRRARSARTRVGAGERLARAAVAFDGRRDRLERARGSRRRTGRS